MRWACLVALAAAGVTYAQTARTSPVSLILVEQRLDLQILGQPPCPNDTPPGEQCISLNVIADVRVIARTLAGPNVPRPLVTRFEFHALPARNYRQILLVRRSDSEPARFDALLVGHARLGRDICVDRAMLSENGVALPREARGRGEQVCFPPRE